MNFKQLYNEVLKVNFSKSIEKFFTYLNDTFGNILDKFDKLFYEKHTKINLQFWQQESYYIYIKKYLFYFVLNECLMF